MKNTERQEKSFGFVVVNKTKENLLFLIIQNVGSEDWCFPKGLPLKNENPIDTASRELEEETGIKNISILPKLKFTDNYKFELNNILVNKKVLFFVCFSKDLRVNIQKNEVKDYMWGDFKQVLERLKFDSQKKILIKVNNYILNNDNEQSDN